MAILPVFQVYGGVQEYDWGTRGRDGSKVGLFGKQIPGFHFDENKPYAELWMGDHPNVPSKVASDGMPLGSLLEKNTFLLGDKIPAHYGSNKLPFLFKVLAIGKALSIQAHPDKKLAQRLFKEKPEVYKDDNHKPEMAIALTDFSGFCGFRPLPQIVHYLENVPEFAAVVGQAAAEKFIAATKNESSELLERSPPAEKPDAKFQPLQQALKALFTALMKADPEEAVVSNLKKLIARYQQETGKQRSAELKFGTTEELVLRLNEQFPDDVGVFCTYMLNVVTLKKGEAVFLKANEPHAYLTGDIIECMATSDNVVRAGLTPKLRDVETLTAMLTYTYGPADSQRMQPEPFRSPAKHTTEYNPPIEEFSVLLVDTTEAGSEQHSAVEGPSIVVITELSGEGRISFQGGDVPVTAAGQTFFIGANTPATFEGKMIAYRAYVEVEE